jgi:peptidoglycan/LPS O-acetylase OafA/YrhL
MDSTSTTPGARDQGIRESPAHMPQLDSLRALAFFGVAASHWLTSRFPVVEVGGTGVQLFFVLSGFLITGILLDYRRIQEGSGGVLGAGSALRTFYARRFLRILPLYYGVIAVAAILNVGPIRTLWPWHAGYVPNILYGIHRPAPSDPFTHFWSLGVEEQFYFVWPFLIFFVRPRNLKWWIVALIGTAPVFRIIMKGTFPEFYRVNYFPFSCGDSLGIGACLAFAARNGTFLTWAAADLARGLGLVGLAGGLLTGAVILLRGNAFWLLTMGHTFLIFLYGWVVFRAAGGFGGAVGRVLMRRELRYLGKISYGLYVFHHFFTYVNFRSFLVSLGLPAGIAEDVLMQSLVRLVVTILLATASWYLYENPINNLKCHFTLRRKLEEARDAKRVQTVESAAGGS